MDDEEASAVVGQSHGACRVSKRCTATSTKSSNSPRPSNAFWRTHMRTTIITGVALSFIAASLLDQTVPNTVDAHIAAATAAAGTEHRGGTNGEGTATAARAHRP